MSVLLLLLVAGMAWFLIAPGQRFLPRFATLLEAPRLQRGVRSFLFGRSYLTGRYKGREVVVRLHMSRHEHELGYLVIAVRTAGGSTLDNSGIESHTHDDQGKRALFSIARQDLLLTVEHGWLKALWRPVGFVIFPGRFSEEKWREVLDSLHTVASSLDASGR